MRNKNTRLKASPLCEYVCSMPQRATPSLLKGRLLCEFSTAGIPKTRFPILDTMPEAFVLFKTEPTHERDVYLSLAEHADVAEVHALYGEFDLLVRISSPTSRELSKLLMQSFRKIEGVRETQTLIAVGA